jgi:hypothetical protein
MMLTARPPLAVTRAVAQLLDSGCGLDGLRDFIDHVALIEALMATKGCITKAAKILGRHRNMVTGDVQRVRGEPAGLCGAASAQVLRAGGDGWMWRWRG